MFQLEGLSRALASLEVGEDKEKSQNEDAGISKSSDTGANIQSYLSHIPTQPPVRVRTFVDKVKHAPEITRSPLRSSGGKSIVDVTTKIYQTTKTTRDSVFHPVWYVHP